MSELNTIKLQIEKLRDENDRIDLMELVNAIEESTYAYMEITSGRGVATIKAKLSECFGKTYRYEITFVRVKGLMGTPESIKEILEVKESL
jgi:hypothetical protein